jgi:3-methyl-2-oxobutanoate hydroxymethyltransferase
LSLQEAGCFSMVLEAMPAPIAAALSDRLAIPTIGIGAGAGCDGQVLVSHDMLGLTPGHTPKFVRRYASLGEEIERAVKGYMADVQSRSFPAEEQTYPIDEKELQEFLAGLK